MKIIGMVVNVHLSGFSFLTNDLLLKKRRTSIIEGLLGKNGSRFYIPSTREWLISGSVNRWRINPSL